MAHKFNVGTLVRLKRLPVEGSRKGVYEVIRLVPPDVDGVPCYRIKDEAGHERAVRAGPVANSWRLPLVEHAGRMCASNFGDGHDPERPCQAAEAPVQGRL